MINSKEDKDILKEIREITKNKEKWEDIIDSVAFFLNENSSIVVKSKILWLLGEMGLNYPNKVRIYIEDIVSYLEDKHPKL